MFFISFFKNQLKQYKPIFNLLTYMLAFIYYISNNSTPNVFIGSSSNPTETFVTFITQYHSYITGNSEQIYPYFQIFNSNYHTSKIQVIEMINSDIQTQKNREAFHLHHFKNVLNITSSSFTCPCGLSITDFADHKNNDTHIKYLTNITHSVKTLNMVTISNLKKLKRIHESDIVKQKLSELQLLENIPKPTEQSSDLITNPIYKDPNKRMIDLYNAVKKIDNYDSIIKNNNWTNSPPNPFKKSCDKQRLLQRVINLRKYYKKVVIELAKEINIEIDLPIDLSELYDSNGNIDVSEIYDQKGIINLTPY